MPGSPRRPRPGYGLVAIVATRKRGEGEASTPEAPHGWHPPCLGPPVLRGVSVAVALVAAQFVWAAVPWRGEQGPPMETAPQPDRVQPAAPVLRGRAASRIGCPISAPTMAPRAETASASMPVGQRVVGRLLEVERGRAAPLARRWLTVSCVEFFIHCGMGQYAVYHTSVGVTDDDGCFRIDAPDPSSGCFSGVVIQCHPILDTRIVPNPTERSSLPRPPFLPGLDPPPGLSQTPTPAAANAIRVEAGPAFELRRGGADTVIGWTPRRGTDDGFRCTWSLVPE